MNKRFNISNSKKRCCQVVFTSNYAYEERAARENYILQHFQALCQFSPLLLGFPEPSKDGKVDWCIWLFCAPRCNQSEACKQKPPGLTNTAASQLARAHSCQSLTVWLKSQTLLPLLFFQVSRIFSIFTMELFAKLILSFRHKKGIKQSSPFLLKKKKKKWYWLKS